MNLEEQIKTQIVASGGWIPFDAFMQAALYTPVLGYYSQDARHRPRFGAQPKSGSDFVTAPVLSPLFGRCVAQQALDFFQIAASQGQLGTDCHIWEFGAGNGQLAAQILSTLASPQPPGRLPAPLHYHIIELSAALQAEQAAQLAEYAAQVSWHHRLPEQLPGLIIGNEVLDAMPVKLLARKNGVWHERGVGIDADSRQLSFVDHVSPLRPPCTIAGEHDYCTEIHPQAEAFMRTIAERMGYAASQRLASLALWLDYGFPEAEYYHEQRDGGTLMCHRAHRSDERPLEHVGDKDLTSHVNFTGIAVAAQELGLELCGYTSQAHFLMNCGLTQLLDLADLRTRVQAHQLIAEHEMGELFKAIAFAPQFMDLRGFSHGDRSHRLG